MFIDGGPSDLMSVLQMAMLKANQNSTYKETYVQLNEFYKIICIKRNICISPLMWLTSQKSVFRNIRNHKYMYFFLLIVN